MQKKIFIMAHSLDIGGAERSLIGLLENIDYNTTEVDLFLLRHEGELIKYLPKQVNLMPSISSYASLGIPIGDAIKRHELRVASGRIFGKFYAKYKIKKLKLGSDNNVYNEYSHKYTEFAVPTISEKEYDLAISYMSPHYFVRSKVNAKKKLAWIHTDYSTLEVDVKSESHMWEPYDYIAAISEQVKQSFLHTFPELNDKIVDMPNVMPTKLILNESRSSIAENEMFFDGSIRILSVGRFSYAKNFDNIPYICKRIRELGADIKWYLIGYGSGESLIRDKIADEQMQDYVIILGKKENPYPYMKKCDVYIQPSRYEGKCVSVLEAQLLGKPVIITNYTTSSSQLRNGIDGIIVPQDVDECANEIFKVLCNSKQLQLVANNAKALKFDPGDTLDVLERIIEE